MQVKEYLDVECVLPSLTGTTDTLQIKMETTGKLFFIDLDSTNGTRVDNVQLEAHEPYELTLSKPTKLEIGGGEYEFVFEQKS